MGKYLYLIPDSATFTRVYTGESQHKADVTRDNKIESLKSSEIQLKNFQSVVDSIVANGEFGHEELNILQKCWDGSDIFTGSRADGYQMKFYQLVCCSVTGYVNKLYTDSLTVSLCCSSVDSECEAHGMNDVIVPLVFDHDKMECVV